MRQFYIFSKSQTVSDQLTWSHYIELLYINDLNKISYYTNITIKQNLSVRQLRQKIRNNEYDRLPDNTKNKLIINEKIKVQDLIKNPIIINNNSNYNEI